MTPCAHKHFFETVSSDFWVSPAGLDQRLDSFCSDACIRFVNGSLQVYGEVNNVYGYAWIASISRNTCGYCDGKHGMVYRLGQFMPQRLPPAHPNCKCNLELIPKTR